MILRYVIPDKFGKYQLDKPPSPQNPGGGVGTKSQRAVEAWSYYYDVEIGETIELDTECLVVDPLWFRCRGHHDLANLDEEEMDYAVTAYENHQAKIKVLYSTELSMLEIPHAFRHRIFQASTVVTTPCRWLEGLYNMQNVASLSLCDPVPESVFYDPESEKELSVVAMGLISSDKNSEMVSTIFKALEGKMKRIYLGSAGLWGGVDPLDRKLEYEISENCDEFHGNVSQSQVAVQLKRAACGVFVTFHETGSESNQESSMAGVASCYGEHGLWLERPGLTNLDTVSDFVNALSFLTKGFTELPIDPHRQEAEQWAMDNCSYTAFLSQWKDVLDYARSQ